MATIEYVMKPQGVVLEEFADCRARNSFIMGPLGSGKTVQVILKLLELMCQQAPVTRESHPNYGVRLSRIIAARNTYSELFSTTIKDWIEVHGDLGEFKQGNKEPPTHRLEFKLEDGTTVKSEVIFIAFDRPEHVKKARGIQTTWVWLNEAKEHSKSVVDMLDLRCGRYPSMKEGVKPTHYGMLGTLMHQMRITGITSWLKKTGQRIGSFTVNRVVCIGKATDGTSTRKQRILITYRKATTGEVCKVRLMIGSRSISRMSTALYRVVSQFIPYTLILSIAWLTFTSLILISLSCWALTSVGLQLVRSFREMGLVAGFVLMNSV